MLINQTVTSSSSGGGWQIGDILYTERKPDADKWLECNGQNVKPSVYSELFGIIGEKYGSAGSTPSAVATSLDSYPQLPIVMPDGKFLIECKASSSSTYYRRLFDPNTNTTTSLSGSWHRSPSYYKYTAVALSNGDVIVQTNGSNCLSRISNVTGTPTVTDITSLTFGRNSYWEYACSAEVLKHALFSSLFIDE